MCMENEASNVVWLLHETGITWHLFRTQYKILVVDDNNYGTCQELSGIEYGNFNLLLEVE